MNKTESHENTTPEASADFATVLCFSHLRWDFVYQRPQHLLTRVAAYANVIYIEEPLFDDVTLPVMRSHLDPSGVRVMTPILPHALAGYQSIQAQRSLLDQLLDTLTFHDLIFWYYTPMALLFTGHIIPNVSVYDCMDQLSAFQGAPPELIAQEKELFARASVVFTGGRSLYEDKCGKHGNTHLFPSSVDYKHFSAGRMETVDPYDQILIPHPRIGFFGVLDERLDCKLLQEVAACEKEWHFVLIGPVVKIQDKDLPKAANIHYLGKKQYKDLPGYLANWDVAMLPFAQNASTRFISPTKTPEYLAAGKPVVSTPIKDVVEPYGRLGLAHIAIDSEQFCAAVRDALEPPADDWLASVDKFLSQTSWDKTFQAMWLEVMRLNSAAKTRYESEVYQCSTSSL